MRSENKNFCMHLKLSCYQLKADYCKYLNVLCNPHGKYKTKPIAGTQRRGGNQSLP